MKKKLRKKEFYFVLAMILAVFVFFLLFRAYQHYSAWKAYHDYFNQPNPKIESWMSFDTISKRFQISEREILNELNVSERQINPRMTLDRFCRRYHQNCTELVKRLNELSEK